jgi:hypothetical protein
MQREPYTEGSLSALKVGTSVGLENIRYVFLKKNVSLRIKLKNKMSYDNFKKLKTVVRKFNLDTRMTTNK